MLNQNEKAKMRSTTSVTLSFKLIEKYPLFFILYEGYGRQSGIWHADFKHDL
jgi:hypothetical protein